MPRLHAPSILQTARLALSASAVLAGAVVPGSATAANNCQGAPGTASVEQYCEALLQVDGGRQAPAKRRSASGRPLPAPPVSVPGALRREGADGVAVARFAAASRASVASAKPKQERSTDRTSGAAPSTDAPAAVTLEGNALSATRHAIEAGPAAGPQVAWGLVLLSGLAVAGTAVGRRRLGPLDPADADGQDQDRVR